MVFRYSMAVISLLSILSVNHCNGLGDDFNLVGENTRIAADDALADAKEKAASWTGWAYDKFSDGIGIGKENTKETSQEAIDKVSDAASKATDATGTAASESAKYAAEKANQGGEKAENIIKMATSVGDAAADAVNSAAEKTKAGASQAFEGTKQKLGETYDGVSQGIEEIRGKKITPEL